MGVFKIASTEKDTFIFIYMDIYIYYIFISREVYFVIVV